MTTTLDEPKSAKKRRSAVQSKRRGPLGKRKRRSSLLFPALIDPVDIPVDAAGRVEFVVIHGVEDIEIPSVQSGDDSIATSPLTPSRWLSVAILGLILLIIFVIGMKLTH